MKRITLTQGKVALVSDRDWRRVCQYNWYAMWDGWRWYARRTVGNSKLYMHRFILGASRGIEVDHRNRNGLDNRRRNLRRASRRQNMGNRGVNSNSASGSKGVRRVGNKWQARISKNGSRRSIGYFHTKKAATAAYFNAAKQWFGEFARAT